MTVSSIGSNGSKWIAQAPKVAPKGGVDDAKKAEMKRIAGLTGDKLLAEFGNLGLTIGEGLRNEIKNNNVYSGYPTLAKGVLILAVFKDFKSFKTPTDGKVPLENIAQTFAEKMDKQGISFITTIEPYSSASNLDKLAEAIFYRWNEKQAQHDQAQIFSDIVNTGEEAVAEEETLF